MIGIIIPTQFNRLNLITKLIHELKDNSFIECAIIGPNFEINKNLLSKNIHFIHGSYNSSSEKKNIGINFFNKKENIKWLWFLDDDCFVKSSDIHILKKLLNFNYNFFFVPVKDINNKNIGNYILNLYFLNFINIYRVGGPSIIIKKNDNIKYFDINFGPGSLNRSSDDTKFLIDNFSFKVQIINSLSVLHPNEIMKTNKMIRYTYGQANLLKKINFFHQLNFVILTFYRPLFALIIVTFFKKNKLRPKKFYKLRLFSLIRGYIK